jgi:hypothetical protein
MSLVVEGLRSDVMSIAELGDDTVAEVAERIGDLLGRSMPARVLELLSDAAADLSSQLPDGRVEIRLAGDDVELTYVEDEEVTADGRPGPGPGPGSDADGIDSAGRRLGDDGDLSARITLRLSEGLKSRVEADAAREGLSVNAYVVRTLERGSSNYRAKGTVRVGNRLRGFGST